MYSQLTAPFTKIATVSFGASLALFGVVFRMAFADSLPPAPPDVLGEKVVTASPSPGPTPETFELELPSPEPTATPQPDPTLTGNPFEASSGSDITFDDISDSEDGSTTSYSYPTPSPSLSSLTPSPSPSASPTPLPTAVPTPAPTRVPTPSPSPVSSPVSSADLDNLFTKYANEKSVDRELLKKIAVCESKLNPNAFNPLGYAGLYQFAESSWRSTRLAMSADPHPALRFNAEEAIKTAAFKIATSGARAWPNCSN